MIIEEAVKDTVVVGEDDSKKAKISQDKLAKLQYLLTKGLYKDPITAVIAEWTNNGIDSVVQAGKSPIENPVMVSINKNDKGQFIFKVEDTGIGLDDNDFENICMNYLESTKEDDNDTIGHFGIGMKSFLSLERSATFTCRKAGIERKYVVYEGAEFVNFSLVHEKPTTEPSGVIAELVINGYSERELFINKAKAKLAYYDTAVIVIDGIPVISEIHRSELFQWSSLNRNQNMHISLKDVYYPIDWEALGISAISVPISIRLGLGDGLTPTPSRESYITNDKVKKILLDKIKAIADWFTNKYNDNVGEFTNFIDAYQFIGNTNYKVKVNTQEILINPLVPFSKHKIQEPKIKGITLRDAMFYKKICKHFLQDHSLVAFITSDGTNRIKNVILETCIYFSKYKTVNVAGNFVGNVREFIKNKYGKNVLYLRNNGFKRKLGGVPDNKRFISAGYYDTNDTYYNILELGRYKKEKWRSLIDEYNLVVSQIFSTFGDERKVDTTQQYVTWLADKQATIKAKRAAGYISSTYNGLNKQTGDVTMAYSYERYGKAHYKKEAVAISSLTNNHFVTVVLTEDEAEEAKPYVLHNASPNVKFAVVGKLERKKLPINHQFITFKQYISMDSKPFMRLASSILYNRAVKEYEKLSAHKNGVFKMCVQTLVKDIETLSDYISKNFKYCGDAKMESIILEAADEHNLYDKEIWDVYDRVRKNMKKFDFVSILAEPDYYDTENQKRYQTVINQLLLFRKKYYNDLDGIEITITPKKAK